MLTMTIKREARPDVVAKFDTLEQLKVFVNFLVELVETAKAKGGK